MEGEKEEEEDVSKLPAQIAAGESWSSLHELALHSVAMRLRSPAYFTALSGVCQFWRHVLSSPSVTADFISSIPPLILLFPRSTSSASASLYCVADDAIYDCPAIPSFQTLAFFGQSNGFLVGLDDSTGSIPSIASPLSGHRVDFPSLLNPVFRFAILTAPPTSPKSRLVLVQPESLLFCPVGGSHWSIHYFPAFSDAIFFQDRLYLAHRAGGYHLNSTLVRVVEYDLESKTKRQIFSGRKGLLVESSEGELLMVFKEQEMLVGFKLLPRMETAPANDGETDWPTGGGKKMLFVGWQRSDLSISCLAGKRMKYRIEPTTAPFWRNYLASSPLRSNGFYVCVDDCGRAEVSNIQPGWLPFRQLL